VLRALSFPGEHAQDRNHDARADKSDDEACDVEARDIDTKQRATEKPTDHGADDAE